MLQTKNLSVYKNKREIFSLRLLKPTLYYHVLIMATNTPMSTFPNDILELSTQHTARFKTVPQNDESDRSFSI